MLHSKDLEAPEKERFLELVAEGYGEQIAAEDCGSTATQFRRLRNPDAAHYDAAFARAFVKAKKKGDENYQDLLRAKNRELALRGNADALKRESLIHLPEYEVLRHQNFRHEVGIDVVLRRALPVLDLSKEEIAQNIEALENLLRPEQPAGLKMLPPAAEG